MPNKYPFDTLKIGQSFGVTIKKRTTLTNIKKTVRHIRVACLLYKRTHKRKSFSIRMVDENLNLPDNWKDTREVRCWRIK